MTGFGRGRHASEQFTLRVEISSVNRKQGEVVCQLPAGHEEVIPAIRECIFRQISRGRLQVRVSFEQVANAAGLRIDTKIVSAALQEIQRLNLELGTQMELTTEAMLRLPNVLTVEESAELDVEEFLAALMPALDKALERLVEMRAREGEDLRRDIQQRLGRLSEVVTAITGYAPEVVSHYREQLLKRLGAAGIPQIDMSDERMQREIGLFAERCDISEEITRLQSHFARFDEFLELDEPVGRSLDFLCQEIHRELNTIGSKANDARITMRVVEGKTELEKIREQVQNVE